MADPMQCKPPEQPSPQGCTLFTSTRAQAGAVAARSIGKRQARILQLLRDNGPLAIFEIAALIGVFEHQISGRFSEMEVDGLIEKAGIRRQKGETGCWAECYRVKDTAPPLDLGESLGYPDELRIDGELYLRQATLPNDELPGIRYIHHRGGGAITIYLPPCPTCGAPMKSIELPNEGAVGKKKILRCGSTSHPVRDWHVILAAQPGHAPMLALILRTL